MIKDKLNLKILEHQFNKAGLNTAISFVKCSSTHKLAQDYSVATDTIIVAKKQKQGIGRLNRKFISKNGGCYFSLVIPQKPDNILFYIPVISVAIATVLNGYGIIANIKWPNDILINGKKICGILCSAHYDKVIISAGLNVFNDIKEIADIATTLQDEGVKDATRARVITDIIKYFYVFLKYDFEIINALYQNFLNINGKNITVKQKDRTISGQVIGITKEGFLLLKTENNQVTVVSGDITVN